MNQRPTTEAILQALEDDMIASHQPFANLPDSHRFPDADCFFYTSRINFGAFGGILAQRFSRESADRRISELNAAIVQTGKEIGWILSPVAAPNDLEVRLVAAGGRRVVELTGMVLDMRDLPLAPNLPDVTVKHVDNE